MKLSTERHQLHKNNTFTDKIKPTIKAYHYVFLIKIKYCS